MEYKLTKPNPTTAEINLVFNVEEISQAYEKAYAKAAPKVQINGFRKGKAPIHLVKKFLGDSVAEDAISILLNDSLFEVYSKLELKPYSQPKISIEKFDKNSELVASASVELEPSISIGDYKNLELHVYEPEVQEKDIESHLKEIQYYLAKTQAKEPNEAIEENDSFEMDLIVRDHQGEEKINRSKVFYFMNRYLANRELEQNFLGMKAEEEKEFDYTYPQNYPDKSLTGETLHHFVKVHSIYRVILPEIGDDLAREFTNGQDDLNNLKEKIKNNLLKSIQNDLSYYYFVTLLNQIIAKSEYHFPKSLIESEALHQFKLELHKYGISDNSITFQTLANSLKKTEEEVKAIYENLALQRLRLFYTIANIARIENISATNEEINQEVEARKSHDPNFKLDKSTYENILISIVNEKVKAFLIEHANKIVEKETSLEKIKEIISK